MYLLGYDIGSSSVKASLVNAETGKCVSSAFFPKTEANIIAVHPGWAEQEPENWWENLKLSTQAIMTESGVDAAEIKAVGISYQMHGLVCVNKNQKVLRPAIIWCDSRAVPYGQKAFETIGEEQSFAPVELSGQFHCLQISMDQRKRTGHLRTDIQDYASGRLHRHETERRHLHDRRRAFGRHILGFQKQPDC